MSGRKYKIRRSDLRHLRSIAAAKAKDAWEVCGLLIDNGHFLQIKETRNLATRKGSFVMDLREIRSLKKAAKKLDLKVIGTFHSHVTWNAEPGKTDIAGTWDGYLMLIVDGMNKEAKLWHVKNNRAYPLSFEII